MTKKETEALQRLRRAAEAVEDWWKRSGQLMHMGNPPELTLLFEALSLARHVDIN